MRRKLWFLLIFFLFLVGRESYCASQRQNQVLELSFKNVIASNLFLNSIYWIFDLHQKKEGWYTCKFYYAAGYRTRLFYNRFYLDFHYKALFLIAGLVSRCLPLFVFFLCIMNINVRIYRGFYIVIPIPVLCPLISILGLVHKPSSQD